MPYSPLQQQPQTTATVFSWDLKINGQSVELPFGGLRFSGTVPEFGVSGIATTQFDFEIYDEYGYYGTAMLENATAELYYKGGGRLMGKFYISKRDISKKVCRFTAYDFTTDTGGEFDPSGLWQSATADYITSGEVLNGLSSQLGIPLSVSNTDDLDMQITREQLKGQTFNGILEMLAAAACGVWCGDGEGGLILIGLDNDIGNYAYGASSTDYAEIDYRGVQQITEVIHTNSETGNIEQAGGGLGSLISVENPLVARGDGWLGTVWQRIGNYQYQAWYCEKALMNSFINSRLLCTTMNFEGMLPLIIGSYTIDVDSTGIYFSGGRDPQSDERWGYEDKLTRTKIGINKGVGNTTITSSGRIEFRNKNKEA